MASIILKLHKAGKLISTKGARAPGYVANTQYEVIGGSHAYGTHNENSDFDVYGFCVPPKEIVFPHTGGYIHGFNENEEHEFQNFQSPKMMIDGDPREYGCDIYSITHFFRLLAENNPNLIATLFVPTNCIIHTTVIGTLVRDNRHMFVHKGLWQKFRGYAFGQLKKAKEKNPEGKRYESFQKYGFDLKFASNIVRLMDECEQFLTTGDCNLERSREFQKAIRRGDVPWEEITTWFYSKETELEKLYTSSKTLQDTPPMDKIRGLLVKCLEEYYGNLEGLVVSGNNAHHMAKDLQEVLAKYGY